MPAVKRGDAAGGERTQHRAKIDAGRKNGEAAGPLRFLIGRVKRSDLGRNIAFQQP